MSPALCQRENTSLAASPFTLDVFSEACISAPRCWGKLRLGWWKMAKTLSVCEGTGARMAAESGIQPHLMRLCGRVILPVTSPNEVGLPRLAHTGTTLCHKVRKGTNGAAFSSRRLKSGNALRSDS